MQDIIQELKKSIQGEVRFDKISRILYSTDASIYEIEPFGVVIPKSLEDVQATIEIAAKNNVPIIPRGAGTSLVGGPIGAGIIVDCSKFLNRVLEVNPEERWARIQPGVVLDQLNNHVKQFNLFFAPDPATSNRANLGGLIGNNSSGARSVIYGKTIDHIISLTVLLANGKEVEFKEISSAHLSRLFEAEDDVGYLYKNIANIATRNREEVANRFPKIMRSVGGYNLDEFTEGKNFNLAKMIVGSEGTLAFVVEAKVKLEPMLKERVLAVIHFSDMFSALEAVNPILEFQPSAVELVDDFILKPTRETKEYARRMTFVEGEPKALLIVEFQGNSKAAVVDRLDKMINLLKKSKMGYAHVRATDANSQANVWYIRKAGLGLLQGIKGKRKLVGFIEDTAVATAKLPDYVRQFDEIVRSHQTEACYYAHASVGCLHIRPLLDLKSASDRKRMQSLANTVSDLVLEYGGAMSGEHGDGLSRSCFNEKMFGSKLYQAFKEIKGTFDPKNIFNPGKIVDAPNLTENLRTGSNGVSVSFDTFLDFSTEGGFETAIEICNGNGVCRKKDTGTMCPSYMVTADEKDSTRGRANALRALLSGKLPKDDIASLNLYDVMDLCVACKGCKGECPTNVDMAKLKYEFLYQYHKVNGLPLRDRLFGHISTLSKIGSFFAPASSWMLQAVPIRWLMHRFLGISSDRLLPPFANKSFEQWYRSHSSKNLNRSKKVVLFNDTFMSYNYPEVGKAAVKVLEFLDYEVIIAEKKCCGRPFISKGMLPQARECARSNIEKLFPFVEDGIPVVGCEPSCILTFRDEYPALIKDSRVEILSKNSFLIEEFIVNSNHPKQIGLKPGNSNFLIHGHCHSKALVGMQPTLEMMKLIPNVEVEVVDSGCCGMAGSFGFEKEHYLISMAMGKRRLFDAANSVSNGTEVVAPGVSCRQQILHGTGVQAKHPIEALAQHLLGR